MNSEVMYPEVQHPYPFYQIFEDDSVAEKSRLNFCFETAFD